MVSDTKAGGDSRTLGWRVGWIARRARNVQRRPESFVTIAAAASIVTLLAFVLVPHGVRLLRPAAPETVQRPDTTALVLAEGQARTRLRSAERALDSARAALAVEEPQPAPADSLPVALRARRDSLTAARTNLARLLRRARRSPLPESYRALGEAPELRREPRVRLLLDSLAEIERSREALGAAGGVDPIFVALTARATELGRQIIGVAAARQAAVRRDLDKLRLPPSPPRSALPSSRTPPLDTLPLVAARDSARGALTFARDTLADARLVLRSIDEREARSRAAVGIPASPFAKLAVSIIIGLGLAFGVAMTRELWRPRIADAREAEWIARESTLGRVLKHPSAPERARRRADREVPPLVDPVTDTFRVIYTELADSSLNLPLIAVLGDSATVTATVAANLAAAAAHYARAALLVDTDTTANSVAAVLRLRPRPGLAEIIAGGAEWTEAIVAATVGRDRQIDVIVGGGRLGSGPVLPGSMAKFESVLAHLRRRYDTVIVSVPVTRLETARAIAGGLEQVIVCARAGRTRIGVFGRTASMVRAAGGEVRGIVLWEAEDPDLTRDATTADDAESSVTAPAAAPARTEIPTGDSGESVA